MKKSDLIWAVTALHQNTEAYALYADYYDGNQRLNFASEKFRNTFGPLFRSLAINHCPVCVDVLADRLQLKGFSYVSQGGGEGKDASQQLVEEKSREIWRRNRMNKRAGEVHQEAPKTGDGYVIVDWQNPDDKATPRATIHPNMAGRCAVKYDDENPGFIVMAAKWWPEANPAKAGSFRIRLNIYYPDSIDRYVTNYRTSCLLPEGANGFADMAEDPQIPNPYGKVPVFHFANNADIGKCGKSELRDIRAPQDALNKVVCDHLVAMEIHALPQRYAIGVEPGEDANGKPISPFRSGLDSIWLAPPERDEAGNIVKGGESQKVEFGQFPQSSMADFIKTKDSFRHDISVISGIPGHYFMSDSGGWPSGEALKTAEQRLASKIADRQVSFGNVWEDVMRFCLLVEGVDNVQLKADWEDTGPRSETQDILNVTAKRALGVSEAQALRELNYSPEVIEKMSKEKAAEAISAIAQRATVVVPTVARDAQQQGVAA